MSRARTGGRAPRGKAYFGNRTALTVDGLHALAFDHDLLGRETERTVDGTYPAAGVRTAIPGWKP